MSACDAFVGLQYAGPNPVAFDIANHWCEYGADYHTDLPHILDYSRMPRGHQQVADQCTCYEVALMAKCWFEAL